MTPSRAGRWLTAATPVLVHVLVGVGAHASTVACLPSARSVVAAAVVTVAVIRVLQVAAPRARPGATAGRAVAVQAFVHAALALSASCTSGHSAVAAEVGALPSLLMISAHLLAVGTSVVLLARVDATVSGAVSGLMSLLSRARELLVPRLPTPRCVALPDLRQPARNRTRRHGGRHLGGSAWSRRGPPAARPA